MDRAAKCRGCGRQLKRDTIEEFEGLCRRDTDTERVPLSASRGCHASFTGFVFRKAARLRTGDTSMNGALPMRQYRTSLRHLVGIDFAEPTAQVLLDEWLEQRLTTSPSPQPRPATPES